MYFVNKFLHQIINKEGDICCLCFNNIKSEAVHFEDEVILVEKSICINVKVTEILSYVFGDEVFKDLSAFDTVCEQCSTSVISVYKFIYEVKSNTQYICKAIEHLTNCFENTTTMPDDCNNLFVSLNTDLCTTNQYYDNISSVNNTSKAFERFKEITESKIVKIESKTKETERKSIIDKSKKTKTTKKGKASTDNAIATLDMLYDKTNPNNIQCKECLKNFLSIPNLRNHFIRRHAPKIFECSECPRSFGSVSFLLAHKRSHVNVVCSECGKSFYNRHTLKMHEKGHYLKLVCQDCGRIYKNHNTFKLHKLNNICQIPSRHSPSNGKYTCDYCQKKYTQKMTLRVHIQYEHLNYSYHECKWCEKKFSCQSRLKAHAVKHTRERNFVCNTCNGKFVTKESLLYHTRIHTGERPYPCPHCESKFLSSSRRTAHIKNHHMDPTVECDVCHSKFRSCHYLQKHKRIHCKSDDSELPTPIKNSKLGKSDNYLQPQTNLHANPVIYINQNHAIAVQPGVKQGFDQHKYKQRQLVVEPGVESNIKLYYEGASKSKLNSNCDLETEIVNNIGLSDKGNKDCSYQMNEGHSQHTAEGDEVYLVVSEEDDYVLKVEV